MKQPFLLLVNTTDPDHPGDGVLINAPETAMSYDEHIFNYLFTLGCQQPGTYRVSVHQISGNILHCSMTRVFEVVVPPTHTTITEIT